MVRQPREITPRPLAGELAHMAVGRRRYVRTSELLEW